MLFSRVVKYLLFLTILGLFLSTCEDEELPNEIYQYSGYDETGAQVVEGSLIIHESDSTGINGAWLFAAIGNPQNIGPQIGSGTFIGSIDSITFYADLNPEYADNNVNLLGTMSLNKIVGIWTYSTLIGVTNQGTFTAEK